MTTNESKIKTITYTMRLKAHLHKALKAQADKEKRSIAKQIEYILEKELKI